MGLSSALSARACREHAADRVPAGRRQPVGCVRVAEHVAPGFVVERDVHVEARAALVVERLGHERGQQVAVPGDLLHRGLQPERAVGRVEQVRVPEVDLELAGRELVVGRRHPQPGVPELPEHVQRARPAGRPCGRPRRRCPGSLAYRRQLPSGRLLAEVELQLGAADQGVARGRRAARRPGGRRRAATPARVRRRGWSRRRGTRRRSAPTAAGSAWPGRGGR